MGYPIVGIVSDGQISIRQAFESLLPDVPYQYCQYHYLKDIAKPVVDADRKLKMELKKSMRGLRDVERKIERAEKKATEAVQAGDDVTPDPSPTATEAAVLTEAQMIKGYVAAVRALLLEDGEPPLELPEPGEDKTNETVEWEMTQVLDWLKQAFTEEGNSVIVDNIVNYSRGFWKGLFTCYNHYFIPRTNNDLEQFYRRITGLRNWNSYIVRNGEMIVLVDDTLRQKHVIARLRTVSYEKYKQRKARWSERLSESVRRRRFYRNPIALCRIWRRNGITIVRCLAY